MDLHKTFMPRARKDDLVVRELDDETLIYDLTRHRAHCLNRAAATVWRRCDGRTPIAHVATELERSGLGESSTLLFALDRLQRARLLEEGTSLPPEAARLSRRVVLNRLAVVGGASILLPLITSINSPMAAAQGSTTTRASCRNNCTGVGLPCSDRNNDPCVVVDARPPEKCDC